MATQVLRESVCESESGHHVSTEDTRESTQGETTGNLIREPDFDSAIIPGDAARRRVARLTHRLDHMIPDPQ